MDGLASLFILLLETAIGALPQGPGHITGSGIKAQGIFLPPLAVPPTPPQIVIDVNEQEDERIPHRVQHPRLVTPPPRSPRRP